MRKAAYSMLFILSLAGAFLAGSWYNQRATVRGDSAQGRKVLYYACPMHPQYRSDKPSDCPACGMRPEPVYADREPSPSPGGSRSSSLPPGALSVSPEMQQRIGVRVIPVEKAQSARTLRLFGRVAPDETRIYQLIAGVEGFVRQVSSVTTGCQVEKDQWLATFSAPEARQPVQAFLVTLDVLDRQKNGGMEAPPQVKAANESIQLAIDRLLNLGLSHLQIEEIRRTREVPTDFRILAPAAGFVLARNVSAGQKFERGTEWCRIADLSRVWILADAFEREAEYLRPGTIVQVSLAGLEKSFSARVSAVLPQFDPASRTFKLRLEAGNPGFALRPGMFVDVALPIALPAAIAVPADAVLDTGLKRSVFVEITGGYFEPRQVETGWRFGDRVEIVSGLSPGERIAVSGTFLIDSESRMKKGNWGR